MSNTDRPDQLEIAHQIIKHIGKNSILSTDTDVWIWNDCGVWKKLPDRELKSFMHSALIAHGHKVYSNHIRGILDVLKTEIYRPDQKWNMNSAIINCKNGELFWENKWILKKHNRQNFNTTQIPFEYDDNAKCPRFSAFLKEIFSNDVDASDKAQVLLELIGYTLASHADLETFVILVGAGANGKSVVLEVLSALLGSNNVCAVQPSKFNHPFQRAHLHMKLANLVSEISEGAVIPDAELKAITSGELTTAEHKGKNPFDFKPFCTCWFGTNHMPHTRDFTDALFRRAVILQFNRTFKNGVDADPNLKNELLKELPGIMFVALAAYSTVIKRGHFIEPESCKKAKQNWRMEVDQVAQFVEEKCVLASNYKTKSSDLYCEYESWANDSGISKKLNRRNFSERLVRLGCALGKSTNGIRMINGIRVGWEEKVASVA